MAYFAYFDLWAAIGSFCETRGYVFTVYIDDVTISGAQVPGSAVWQIRQMIYGSGLRYHKQKTFVGRPAEVTGVILRNGELLAPFRQHRKLNETRKRLRAADLIQREALKSTLAGVAGQIAQIGRKNQSAPPGGAQ